MSASAHRVKSKRSASSKSKLRRYWWLVPVGAVVAFLAWTVTAPDWSRPRTGKVSDMGPLQGYVMSFATVSEEYKKFNGKPLTDKAMSAQFDQATQHMAKHDYGIAAQM